MPNPPSGDKKNIVKLAYLYFQEGRWDNAIEEYQKLLELDPEDMNVHNMLGDVYVKKNNALLAYEKYNKVAEDLVNRGQMDKAIMIHRKIARLDSSQLPDAARQKQNLIQLHTKADDAMEQGNTEEAIAAYTEIVKLNPEDLIVASKLAELDEKTGRINDSVQQYLLLGESFMKSHLYKKAQEMFKKVSVMDPQNTVAHLNLAQIYLKQGSENDAKKEYLNVAESALAKDDLQVALDNANKAVELKSIEAHYIVGVVLFKQEKWNEAKTEFDNLLRFKLNHVGALVYSGRVFVALNQMDKANELFQKALKADKENLLVLEAMADFNLKRKNKPEATTSLNQLIDKLVATNDTAGALGWAKKLVEMDPKVAASQEKLAEVMIKNNDPFGAADVYFDLSTLMTEQNKTAESEAYLKKTLELNPTHARAIGGSTFAAPEETAPVVEEPPVVEVAAAKPQAQMTEVNPEEAFKAQVAIADQYVKQGLLDEAIEIYQQLQEVDPDNTEIKTKLNGVYSALAKTGTDLSGVFAAPKAPEPVKAAEPAPKPAVDAAKQAAEAKQAADEAAKKNLKELEAKAREEADKRARIELEKRAREEADKRADEEIKRLAAEKLKKAQEAEAAAAAAVPPPAPAAPTPISAPAAKTEKPLPPIGGLDDMFAVAEADLLHSKGKHEEAAAIYRNVLKAKPNDQVIQKKLSVIEETLRKAAAPPPAAPEPAPAAPAAPAMKAPPVLKVVEPPASAAPGAGENDSNNKKKSNKIGYV